MDRDTGRKNAKGGTIWESADFNGTNDEINAAWGNPRDPDDGRSFKRLIEERTSFGHEPPSADFADEPRKENA